MAETKQSFTVDAASVAAYFSTMALVGELARKGVLTIDETNGVYATAASMCRANGQPDAAALIELSVPSSKGVDPVARAQSLGATIERKG